jgi:hypothetical protein
VCAVVALHLFQCPECRLELCGDPRCHLHPIESWASIHAELHPMAMKALLLYGDCRDSGSDDDVFLSP